MLRINLLPPYIYEGSKRTKVAALWAVILLVVLGGMLFWTSRIKAQTNDYIQDKQNHQADADLATKDKADAANIQTASKDIVDKATFVRQAIDHDRTVYPHLYDTTALYTWNRVKYDSIQPSGDTVNIQAYTPLLRDIGQYMLAMERNPDINRVDVQTTDLQGFPPQGPGTQAGADMRPGSGHTFTVSLHLAKPIPAGPAYGGGGGAEGGAGGMGGGMMGSGGMMMGGPAAMGGSGGFRPPQAGGMSTGAMMSGGGKGAGAGATVAQ